MDVAFKQTRKLYISLYWFKEIHFKVAVDGSTNW